jgi:uncharacterized protein (TIGR02145 family)
MSFDKKNKTIFKKLPGWGLLIFMPFYFTLFFSCIKDEPRLMKVLNDKTTDESYNSVIIYITVVDIGEGIDQYGYCWSIKTDNPTIGNDFDTIIQRHITEPLQCSDTIKNLIVETKYYIKAYLKKGNNVVYSNSLPFNTLPPKEPDVRTDSVTNITAVSCRYWGEVISECGDPVTARGVCWGTSSMPDLESDTVNNGSGLGHFNGSITGLISNKIYYIRAYATNINGTAFGLEDSFKTVAAYLEINPGVRPVSSASGSTSFSISSNIEWSVNDDASWLTATKSNEHTINVSYNANMSTSSRTANITVTGQGLIKKAMVTQSGNPWPTLLTAVISNVTDNSAKSGGYSIYNGGTEVIHKGVCWNTTVKPVSTDGHTDEGSGTNDFVSYMTNLLPGTEYYFRAYATNSAGTGYGPEDHFKTKAKPTVTTGMISAIAATSATIGGTVIDDGGVPLTSWGICWNKTKNPTISDHITPAIELISGTFVCNITGLEPLTKYYAKAYAENIYGISYGSEIEFTTLWGCGAPFADFRNGKFYRTVQIGSQCWMAQNLNIGTRMDVLADQTNNGEIEKYCYNDRESSCDTFGGIYQWDEMMQYTITEPAQGICPEGWHIPSDHEWQILEVFLGMSTTDANNTGWRGTDEGGQLKAAGYLYWNSPNTGATDSSGFTALAAGWVYNTSYREKGYSAVFWTSTPDLNCSWFRYMTADQSKISRGCGDRPNGTPVRCIKD